MITDFPPPSAPPSAPPPSRRGFLGLATWALGAVAAAVVAVPVLGTMLAPVLARRDGAERSPFLPAIKLSELKVGVPRRVELTRTVVDAWARQDGIVVGAAWLLRQPSGEVVAFSTLCPHLGCGIDYEAAQGRFRCPCHTSSFDLGGARTGGPSPRGMDRLETSVQDGWVRVRYVRYKQGLPKPEEA